MASITRAGPLWAELLPEVAQRIAGLLEDDDRQARVAGKRRRHRWGLQQRRRRPPLTAAAGRGNQLHVPAACVPPQTNGVLISRHAQTELLLPCCHGSRAAMLRSCAAWRAAIQAVPALWPQAVLVGSNAHYDIFTNAEGHTTTATAQQAQTHASESNKRLLLRAAGLDALTWRVRVVGGEDQVRAMDPVVFLLPFLYGTMHPCRCLINALAAASWALRCLANTL